MADVILILDAGSSSLKFAAYEVGGSAGRPSRLARGQVEGLRAKPRFQVFDADGRPLDDAMLPDTGQPITHDEAMGRVLTWRWCWGGMVRCSQLHGCWRCMTYR
jgi:acetate kinase